MGHGQFFFLMPAQRERETERERERERVTSSRNAFSKNVFSTPNKKGTKNLRHVEKKGPERGGNKQGETNKKRRQKT